MITILFTALLVMNNDTTKASINNKMEKEKAEDILLQYIDAVDAGDVNRVAPFLAPEFRVVLTNFQNSNEVKLLDKEQYLGLMKEGKVGGKKRTATILLTDIHRDAALVKIKLEGEIMSFTNYYSLVKSRDQWLIVQDIPQTEKKN